MVNNLFIFLLILQLGSVIWSCCVIRSSCVIKKMIFTWYSKVQSSSVWQLKSITADMPWRSSYEKTLKCKPCVFNVSLIKVFRRSASLLARFGLFVWKVSLKTLGSLYKSVSFESKEKNACGKAFVSSLKNMTRWEMTWGKYRSKLNWNVRSDFVDSLW